MKIRYCNTIDDSIAFNKFHWSKSPRFQKNRRRQTIYIPILLAAFVLFVFILTRELDILIIGSVCLPLYVIIIVWHYKRTIPQSIKKTYEESDNKSFFCEHVLEIDDDGIIATTEYGQGKTKWKGIQRVETCGDYTFVYVGAMSAHIIPKLRIIEGDYDLFVQEIMKRVASYK